MKRFSMVTALVLALGATALPAFARDTFVVDNAHLLSAATISEINAKVADFEALAHKEVFVDIEPTLDGSSAPAAAQAVFAREQVNGLLIYVVKSPKTLAVIPDRAARAFFPATATGAIRTAIASAFNAGDFNGGISNGVDLALDQYRSHLGSARAAVVGGESRTSAPVSAPRSGFHWGWLLVILVLGGVAVAIVVIVRALSASRVASGYAPTGPMMGGSEMGSSGLMMGGGYGNGYAPGYGGAVYPEHTGGGAGQSFVAGLAGGIGGAFIGNEVFGDHHAESRSSEAGIVSSDSGSSSETSGFQNDAGQADMGNASFGSWGTSSASSGDDAKPDMYDFGSSDASDTGQTSDDGSGGW